MDVFEVKISPQQKICGSMDINGQKGVKGCLYMDNRGELYFFHNDTLCVGGSPDSWDKVRGVYSYSWILDRYYPEQYDRNSFVPYERGRLNSYDGPVEVRHATPAERGLADDKKKEVFPGIFVGEVVVSSGNHAPFRNVGDLVHVLPDSESGRLWYTNSVGSKTNSTDPSSWRKATLTEVNLYNIGVKNVNEYDGLKIGDTIDPKILNSWTMEYPNEWSLTEKFVKASTSYKQVKPIHHFEVRNNEVVVCLSNCISVPFRARGFAEFIREYNNKPDMHCDISFGKVSGVDFVKAETKAKPSVMINPIMPPIMWARKYKSKSELIVSKNLTI